MTVSGEIDLGNTDNNNFQQELNYTKFRNSGVKLFGLSEDPSTPLEKIKEAAKLYSFNLPINQTEILFAIESAPVFWLLDSPLLNLLDAYYKNKISDKDGMAVTIKDVFSKWILLPSDKEKKFFAASTLSYIEDNLDKNFLLYSILYAMILAYEESVFDPEKALSFMEKAEERLDKMEIKPDFKNEFKYYLKVYKGFILIRSGNNEGARQFIEEALIIKPTGINAKFQLLFITPFTDAGAIMDLVNEITDYDIFRSDLAISLANPVMYNFFIQYNVSKYIFTLHHLSEYRDSLLEIMNEKTEGKLIILERLKKHLKVLGEYSIKRELRRKDYDELNFFNTVISAYKDHPNLIFQCTLNSLEVKFIQLVKDIIDYKREQQLGDINHKLKSYDYAIKEYKALIDRLNKEESELLLKIKKAAEEEIIKFEKRLNEQITMFENKIKNIKFDKSLDPQYSFRNSMTYGIIITIIVFIIGGFAGYSNSVQKNISELLAAIIITGIKWSGITLIVSFIFALIIAGSVVWERSNERTELMRRINLLKNNKDMEIKKLKQNNERKEKALEDNYRRKREKNEREIKKHEIEKKDKEDTLREEAEERIHYEISDLLPLIS